jgi:hypothetical protein
VWWRTCPSRKARRSLKDRSVLITFAENESFQPVGYLVKPDVIRGARRKPNDRMANNHAIGVLIVHVRAFRRLNSMRTAACAHYAKRHKGAALEADVEPWTLREPL